MLPGTVTRWGCRRLRRCLLHSSVSCQGPVTTAGNEDHRSGKSKTNHLRIAVGAVISGGVVYSLGSGEDNRTRGQSLLSRLANFKPVVSAAEPTGNKSVPSKSRRKEFNFIADLVEETGGCLVRTRLTNSVSQLRASSISRSRTAATGLTGTRATLSLSVTARASLWPATVLS